MTTESQETAAPVAAPAAAPAPTPAPAPAPRLGEPAEAPPAVFGEAGSNGEFVYDSTGDAGLDYALNFVGKLGFGDTHPAIQAASNGDFALLRVELATKGVAGADAVVALAEAAYQKHTKATADSAQVITDFAHTLAGGAENWEVISAWASANADPDEKADLNEALAKGGAAARRALKYIVDGYKGQNALPKEPAVPVRPGAAASAGPATGPLTAKAYADAVLEIQRAAKGRDISESPEYLNLQQQRLAARRAGIA